MTDDEILAEIEIRCENWRRCFMDISPRQCSSLQKVIDALIRQKGGAEKSHDAGNSARLPKDMQDAAILETVWTQLATEEDRRHWQIKMLVRCGVFLRSVPLRKLCRICRIRNDREWKEAYRKALVFFGQRVKEYDRFISCIVEKEQL